MKHIKLYEAFDVNEGLKPWRDQVESSIKGDIYYMPKGTMILKDRTKRERPAENGMWMTVNNSTRMEDGFHGDERTDVVYFRKYPADYTVKFENLESDDQKDLKKRYLEFKKEQKVGGLKRGKANWGFGDEGETGSYPHTKKMEDDIAFLDKLMKTVR